MKQILFALSVVLFMAAGCNSQPQNTQESQQSQSQQTTTQQTGISNSGNSDLLIANQISGFSLEGAPESTTGKTASGDMYSVYALSYKKSNDDSGLFMQVAVTKFPNASSAKNYMTSSKNPSNKTTQTVNSNKVYALPDLGPGITGNESVGYFWTSSNFLVEITGVLNPNEKNTVTRDFISAYLAKYPSDLK